MVLPELPFSIETEPLIGPGSYRPIFSKSSGIITAWSLFGISGLAGGYLYLRGIVPPLSLWITTVIMLLIALAISFSYWLERRTLVIIEDKCLRYESPLRKIIFQWDEIHELWCLSIRGGWRFTISSSTDAFRFETLNVRQFGSGREVRSGFTDGKRIAALVQKRADLRILDRQDRLWIYRREGQTEPR